MISAASTLNRFLIPFLESRYGRRLGERLAVARYSGRRSGRPHQLVTQYVREGTTVRIDVGRADAKTWWRNFQGQQPIDLHLAGVDRHLTAHVVREGSRVWVVSRPTAA
jgi:hypothetical protein